MHRTGRAHSRTSPLRFAATAVAFATTLAGSSHALAQAVHVASAATNAGDIDALARHVAEMHTERAVLLEREGHLHEAESLFRRAIEADASYLPGYLGAARLLEHRARRAEALALLSTVPPATVDADDDLVALARAYASLGDVPGALALLASRPARLTVQRARVQLATDSGRFPEALAVARRVAEMTAGTVDERPSRLLARALALIVGDADAVRAPRSGPSRPGIGDARWTAIRRLLVAPGL